MNYFPLCAFLIGFSPSSSKKKSMKFFLCCRRPSLCCGCSFVSHFGHFVHRLVSCLVTQVSRLQTQAQTQVTTPRNETTPSSSSTSSSSSSCPQQLSSATLCMTSTHQPPDKEQRTPHSPLLLLPQQPREHPLARY